MVRMLGMVVIMKWRYNKDTADFFQTGKRLMMQKNYWYATFYCIIVVETPLHYVSKWPVGVKVWIKLVNYAILLIVSFVIEFRVIITVWVKNLNSLNVIEGEFQSLIR